MLDRPENSMYPHPIPKSPNDEDPVDLESAQDDCGPPLFVELETSSKCNRRCAWCPDGTVLDRSFQQLMPIDLLNKILCDLVEFGFVGELSLHNYNEPLASPRIVDDYRAARASLPDASLALYTNGDYLTPRLFDSLVSAGISRMRISRYPSRYQDHWFAEDREPMLRAWIRRAIGPDIDFSVKYEDEIGMTASSVAGEMKVEVRFPDIPKRFVNRGGSVPLLTHPSFERAVPCNATKEAAAIDYQGNLRMCCNIIAGWGEHKIYVVGSLVHQSFRELWCSRQMQDWRSRQLRAEWSASPICRSCEHRVGMWQKQHGS